MGPRLLRAWLLTALIDGAFSGALAQFAYGSSVIRLFQGVAATLFGQRVMASEAWALVGVLMHFGVAFAWSTVFLALVAASPWLRRVLAAPGSLVMAAVVYGPCIWLVMSLAVVPFLTGRPPVINGRWWVNLVAHIPFVAMPIVVVIGGGVEGRARSHHGRLEERIA